MGALTTPAERKMTVAKFLAYDDGTGTRYELVDGELVAMAPPSTRHTDICENIGEALRRQAVAPCRVYVSKAGAAVADDAKDRREPDVMVACERPEAGYFRLRLVVEVLSPSTEKKDRTTKLDFCEGLPTVDAILLVWQDQRRVRLRTRGEAGWQDQDTVGSGVVRVASLGAELALDEIYHDPWGEVGEAG